MSEHRMQLFLKLLSTFLDRAGEKIEGALDLRGDEGVIIGV